MSIVYLLQIKGIGLLKEKICNRAYCNFPNDDIAFINLNSSSMRFKIFIGKGNGVPYKLKKA